MRLLKSIEINKLLTEYKYLIGWGTGPVFWLNYREQYFKLDYLIDGRDEDTGKYVRGIKVSSPQILSSIGDRSLIIIYTIYEAEVLEQLKEFDSDIFDVIVYPLVNVNISDMRYPVYYAKCSEDIILFSLINQLKLDQIRYLEIGVCHPIIRNNTYFLNKFFGDAKGYKGVLVEANPLCWKLIEEYRQKDVLVKKGICTNPETDKLEFYMFPNLLGHSTFSKEIAEGLRKDGYDCNEINVSVTTLDRVIEEYFDDTPDILAIDAEGMDYEIICNWNHEDYPFKIIITEMTFGNHNQIQDVMEKKGYMIYARTMENAIWVRNDYNIVV